MAQENKEIGCKWSKAVYMWPRDINRKWGNNHVVLKFPPLAMAALQAKDESLVSQADIMKDYFKLKGIAWNPDFLWLNAEAPEAAKADTVLEKSIELDRETLDKVKANIAKLGEDKVRLLLAAAHFSPEHIDFYVGRALEKENPFL